MGPITKKGAVNLLPDKLMKNTLLLKNNRNSLFYLCITLEGIAEALQGYLQLYTYYISNNGPCQLIGSFQNPGPYGGFLAVILPIATSIVLSSSGKDKIFRQILSILAWMSVILILSILPSTMSRAAWLAAGTGIILVLILHYNINSRIKQYIRRHWRQALLYLVICCFFLSVVVIGIYHLKKDSADGRLLMWKVTMQIITEHPLIGIGLGNFAGSYGESQAAYFTKGNASFQEEHVAGSPKYAFNEFLQITAETGILGLVVFLLIVALAFFAAYKSKQIGIIGSLAAFLTFACFSYPFSICQFDILFIILLFMALRPLLYNNLRIVSNKRKIYVTIIILVLILPLLIKAGRKWQDKQRYIVQWREEQGFYNMEIYEETVDNYRKLYPQLRDEPKFLFELGQCLSKTGSYAESNRILLEGAQQSSDPMFWNIMGKNYKAMKNYSEAERCFIHAYNMVPNRLYPLYLLTNLYFDSGETEKGIAMARMVIAKEPKVMSPAIEEMKTKLKEKIDKANYSSSFILNQ